MPAWHYAGSTVGDVHHRSCCEEIDFFSIGSNDLTQYPLAVDHDNAKVTRHYNSLNPAFLRALDYAVQAVHRQGKWIGLCGELGSEGSVLPLLVGLGLDELSMSAPSIPVAKARMAQLDSRECRKLLNQAMACPYFAGSGTPARAIPHDPTGRTAGHRRVHHAGK
ncbi:putative PEP-binding protein [Escherichia coli]